MSSNAYLTLQEEFGYVILVGAFNYILNFVQTVRIGQLRKKFSVDYPAMYSEEHQEFNCAQRVHQNSLEQLPFFLFNLPCAGIRHPIVAAVFGGVYFLARIIYSVGYWSGKPSRRVPGSVLTLICQLGVFCTAVSTAAGFLGVW